MLKVKKQLPVSQAEELAKLQEETGKLIAKERIPNQDAYEEHDRQRGTMLDSNEVVRRILKMNSSVWVEDSLNCPGHANFYYSSWMTGAKACAGAPFKKGSLREFSIVYHDTAGRPTGVEYGWREILHRLLKKALITWQQIQMNFPVYEMRRSRDFDRQTRRFKN